MQTTKNVLENGVRVLTSHMPSMESATLMIWVGVGSRYETPQISGISHFLEHMVFKGGSKYKTAKEISEKVDAMGAEFNAGTGKDTTNFYIKARVGLIEDAFDVLSDIVFTPLLKPDDIERERGVILAEMDMYEDTPRIKVGEVFDNSVFEGSTLGWDIIGNKETISKQIQRNDFLSFRDNHYTAQNIVIALAGGVSPENALKLSNKYFSSISNNPIKGHDSFRSVQSSPKIKLVNKPVEQAHMIIGFLGDKLGHKDRFVEEVLASILGGGMSSRLFTEVREKRGLAYAVRTANDGYTDTGTFATYAGVEPKKALEALRVIIDEHNSIAGNIKKISDKELTKAKEYIKGHIALSLEGTSEVASFFAHDELLLGRTETPEEIYKGIDEVTQEDVVRYAKEKFVKSTLNLAVIGPFDDSKEFEKVIN